MTKPQSSVIELHLTRKEKGNEAAWALKHGFFSQIEQWVQHHRRWTSPLMFLILAFAFSAAFSPWFHHYQVAKEVAHVSASLSSFRDLYIAYGDGNASASSRQARQPLTALLDSMEAKMHVVGIPPAQISRVRNAWDPSYQLTGATKEIMIRAVSRDACQKLATSSSPKTNLRDAVINQIKHGKHREPGCYLQSWKGEPDTAYLPYSFMSGDYMVTPLAYIILREPEKSPAPKKTHTTSQQI